MARQMELFKVCDKPIAWVCETYIDSDGLTQQRLIRSGMTRSEIIDNFPPDNNKGQFNRALLVRSIIYEAYQETKNGVSRDRGNIRSFWYERLMYVLRTVMGDNASQDSLDVTINKAWGDLVDNNVLTYADLNLYSEKESAYNIQVKKDSPYPRVIVFVEKESYFDVLRDIADVYEIAFCAAGGQASKCAAFDYLRQLRDMDIDLSLPFTVFSFCDFDPEGWSIPVEFIHHLKTGGVIGEIELIRVGVLPSEIGSSVRADIYPLEKDGKPIVGKQTKWDNWAAETSGIWATDSNDSRVPGRIEMNIYRPAQIREKIITALCEHLDGFAFQIRNIKRAVFESGDTAYRTALNELTEKIEDNLRPFYEELDKRRFEIFTEMESRTAHKRARADELFKEIKSLKEEMADDTKDLVEKIDMLEELKAELDLEKERIVENSELSETYSVSDLVDGIESNGGWRDFADELDIKQTILREDLKVFGTKHNRVWYFVGDSEREKIEEWVYEQMEIEWQTPNGASEELQQRITELDF